MDITDPSASHFQDDRVIWQLLRKRLLSIKGPTFLDTLYILTIFSFAQYI